MTDKIKLFNQGHRAITHSLGVLAPGKAVVLPQAEALKLKKLYKKELVDMEALVEEFEAKPMDEVVDPAPAPAPAAKAKPAPASKADEEAKLLAELEAEEAAKAKAAKADADKK